MARVPGMERRSAACIFRPAAPPAPGRVRDADMRAAALPAVLEEGRTMRPIYAWHFAPSADRLRGGLPWAVGVEEVHDGPLVLCDLGLHASVDPIVQGDMLALAGAPLAFSVDFDEDEPGHAP